MRIAVFVAAGLVVLTGFLHAQSDDDEDEMDYTPLVPTGSSFRFGLRYVGGPKVAFKDVCDVPATVTVFGVSDVMARTYNDGNVNLDTRPDSNGNPRNDGLTNSWSVNYSSQINSTDNTIAYHVYSASPLAGGQVIHGSTASASGWELQVGRSLGKIARKVDVSLVGGFTFSGINAKNSSIVDCTLQTVTDVFRIDDSSVAPTAPYTAPMTSTQVVYDSNGLVKLNSNGSPMTITVDTSVLLNTTPTRTTTQSTGQVSGHWQIKGAYYTFRLGPVFQFPVTERFKISLGFGGAVAYVGSTYKADEEIIVEDVTNPITNVEEQTRNLLLPVIYADADAEYWVTDRTGLYLGATYQRSKSFDQTLGGRSATVDMGSTSGITSGLTLRF